jgi:hypothetical protein
MTLKRLFMLNGARWHLKTLEQFTLDASAEPLANGGKLRRRILRGPFEDAAGSAFERLRQSAGGQGWRRGDPPSDSRSRPSGSAGPTVMIAWTTDPAPGGGRPRRPAAAPRR